MTAVRGAAEPSGPAGLETVPTHQPGDPVSAGPDALGPACGIGLITGDGRLN